MSAPGKKRAPVVPSEAAKLAKQLAERNALIEKQQARLKELTDEVTTLREHCSTQDALRRTEETKHSEELGLILTELKALRAQLTKQ